MPLGHTMMVSRTHHPHNPFVAAGWAWNTEHVADANCLLLLHCEDNAATTVVVDSAAGGTNGTCSANTNTIDTVGQFNNGFLVTTENINHANIISTDSQGTFEAWIKTVDADGQIMGEGVTMYSITIQVIATLACFYVHDGGWKIADSDAAVNDGAWHHIAGTWVEGGNVIMYVDGVAQATTAALGGRTHSTGNFIVLNLSTALGCTCDEFAVSNIVRYP